MSEQVTENIAMIEEVVRTDMEETAMTEEIDEEEQEEITEEELVFYEKIDGTERYRWIGYLNIRVIEDTDTGYINATKMCSMYGKTKGGEPKQFSVWKPYNKKLYHSVTRVKIENINYVLFHKNPKPIMFERSTAPTILSSLSKTSLKMNKLHVCSKLFDF